MNKYISEVYPPPPSQSFKVILTLYKIRDMVEKCKHDTERYFEKNPVLIAYR